MMRELATGIYAVPGLSTGRVYVLKGRDGLALVDTSLAARTADKLETQLREQGFDLGSIRHILITHAHPDHVGGLAELQRRTQAMTCIHHRDAAVARGEMPMLRPRPQGLKGLARWMALMPSFSPPTPARIDREWLSEVSLDEIVPGMRVVETPGHSPGHISLWLSEQRTLISGDAVMLLPWGLSMPIAAFTPDMDAAKRSVRKLAELDVTHLCPGHGAPLIGNAGEKLRAFAARLG